MRCCASPTTSIAADPRSAEPAPRDAQDEARRVMSAVLFREILKPLAQGLGPVGEIALGAVADDLFVRRR
jgi:hypothetical protein